MGTMIELHATGSQRVAELPLFLNNCPLISIAEVLIGLIEI